MDAKRAAIIHEAATWLGTPWAHAHDCKGGAVDCAMLLVRVYVDSGILPPFDPRPYPEQWFLHRDRPLFLEFIETFGHRVERALPGDIAMFRWGRHAAHGAIIVNDYHMIHAFRPAGRVILDSRTALDGRLDSYWSLFGADT